MSTWVIPYSDQDIDFWQEIQARFGEQITEVYFPMPAGKFPSGRGRQPEQHMHEFLQHAPLPKGVLVNPIILPRPAEAIASDILLSLRRMHDDYGVQSVTVANPDLARSIKDTLPGWQVNASVLMGIARPEQAWLMQDFVDSIAVDTRLVRDLAGLRQLRSAYSGAIRMIVNEACLPGCLYRTQHFYEMGYGTGLPKSLCQPLLEERPWLRLTGAWVLPRHLKFFDGLYDTLKLAGRVTLRDRDRYFQVLSAYVKREPILPRDIGGGPASPLLPIEVSDEWFEQVLNCDKQCNACSICRAYYNQALQELEGKSQVDIGASATTSPLS